MNGIKWRSSPVGCGLCQVVAAGSESSCELTDYYWIPDGLSVCHQHTCRYNGDEEKTNRKTPAIYSTCFNWLLTCVCLFQLPSLLRPNFPCPFSDCGDHLTCLLRLSHEYSGFANHLYTFVMFLQPEAISTFTSEPALVSFAKFFCKTSEDSDYVS